MPVIHLQLSSERIILRGSRRCRLELSEHFVYLLPVSLLSFRSLRHVKPFSRACCAPTREDSTLKDQSNSQLLHVSAYLHCSSLAYHHNRIRSLLLECLVELNHRGYFSLNFYGLAGLNLQQSQLAFIWWAFSCEWSLNCMHCRKTPSFFALWSPVLRLAAVKCPSLYYSDPLTLNLAKNCRSKCWCYFRLHFYFWGSRNLFIGRFSRSPPCSPPL